VLEERTMRRIGGRQDLPISATVFATTNRNLEEAVERAAKVHPDLVLMDITLNGEMNGIEAGRQIRARFGIPVIYLTATRTNRPS
jgi:CheY-like chemotaxis protein